MLKMDLAAFELKARPYKAWGFNPRFWFAVGSRAVSALAGWIGSCARTLRSTSFSTVEPGLKRPAIYPDLDIKANRNAVLQQSPASHSARWVSLVEKLYPNGVLQNPSFLVQPRWGRRILSMFTQGALRDPGLCCQTPLAFLSDCVASEYLTYSAQGTRYWGVGLMGRGDFSYSCASVGWASSPTCGKQRI